MQSCMHTHYENMADMKNGATSLMVASQTGHVEVVDELLQHGARVNLREKVSKNVVF